MRLSSRSSSELLKVEFSAVNRPGPFMAWIANSWFPQALIDTNAAVVLSGARPVRAVIVGDDKVEIRWEKLSRDLKAEAAGTRHDVRYICISIIAWGGKIGPENISPH